MRVTDERPFRSPEAQRLADQTPPTTGAASRRLPAAPRERRPALAALAVLLIVGGALITVTLVLRSGDRVSAIAIARHIGAGQRIPLDALQEVPLADDGVPYVAWAAREQVAQNYAAVDLVPGTLLNEQMVAMASSELRPGRAVVGLSLKAGQVPPGLSPGDRVQVIYVPGEDSSDVPRILAANALVNSVSGADASTGSSAVGVAVVVADDVSAVVSAYASQGKIAVAYLPGVSAGRQEVVVPTPTASGVVQSPAVRPTPIKSKQQKPAQQPVQQQPTGQPTQQPTGGARPSPSRSRQPSASPTGIIEGTG
ncbi:hypothetical protein J5X84_19690 [Streptosporangiaceae bacterium NEAU-GS5]|nr:hypothetical protein [Streptosporangiaceae bacterium NEAU-GS5]